MQLNYDLLAEVTLFGNSVRVHQSKLTGFRVVLAQIESPIVHINFMLPTICKADNGLPHTLEHLVFLGSESYPVKGVLDHAANRFLAQGTNAWTAVDHTAYTCEIAGDEGVYNIIPVYFDHLFFPLLEEKAFLSEVHHVDREGASKGVVYSEMEERETNQASVMERGVARQMYGPDSGYHYETGGMLGALRDLEHSEVVAYHEETYVLPNMTLVVIGRVDEQRILGLMADMERYYVSKRPSIPEPRHLPTEKQPLGGERSTVLQFPSDDEETGSMTFSWRTGLWAMRETHAELSALEAYLSKSSTSALHMILVEGYRLKAGVSRTTAFRDIADVLEPGFEPLCGSVGLFNVRVVDGYHSVALVDVPVDAMAEATSVLRDTLARLPVNVDVLRGMIDSTFKEVLWSGETEPHESTFDMLAGFLLYGENRPEELVKELDLDSIHAYLMGLTHDRWLTRVDDFFKWSEVMEVAAKPSKKLVKQISGEKSAREKRTVDAIGAKALEARNVLVDEAVRGFKAPPPAWMIEKFPAVSVGHVRMFDVRSVSNLEPSTHELHPLLETCSIPLQIIDVPGSKFVKFSVVARVPDDAPHTQYLTLLAELMFDLPVLHSDGSEKYSVEDLQKRLTDLFVAYQCGQGFEGSTLLPSNGTEFFCAEAVALRADAQAAYELFCDCLLRHKMDLGKISATAASLKKKARRMRRSTRHIAACLSTCLNFGPQAIGNRLSFVAQHRLLCQ
ncbi:MAG: uncharacterized protein KVP18_002036 [Porospora cf. gigantea A]|nr:MAG: hypothetical protein KVP18_002036 [Porospora cf. gigantea A]